jgi:hypothetical protein
MHSLAPEGTTQRIRRSRHEAHATEALWRGFDSFSFVEWLLAEICPDVGPWTPCSFSVMLAILVCVGAVMAVWSPLSMLRGATSKECTTGNLKMEDAWGNGCR